MAKNQGEDMRADELDSSESSPRVYELGFHLDPELPSEEVKKAYQAMREFITSKGALVAEGEPVALPLAYTISRQETSGRRDFSSAHFAWIVYETSAEHHAEVLKAANADKRIIRFIDLLTTKEAARHAVEMHELSLKTPEAAPDAEAALGAELDTALENVAI